MTEGSLSRGIAIQKALSILHTQLDNAKFLLNSSAEKEIIISHDKALEKMGNDVVTVEEVLNTYILRVEKSISELIKEFEKL